jgi:hypothetical protein
VLRRCPVTEPHDGVAAVLKNKGQTVGMGIVVDSLHVVTCAHVVNAAVGRDDSCQQQPEEPLALDFPFSTVKRTRKSKAALVQWLGDVVGWYPVQLPDCEHAAIQDVAVIRLKNKVPDDVRAAVLFRGDPPYHGDFTTYRFCAGDPKGDWAPGEVGARVADETVELRGTAYVGTFIEPGFSGGGCWNKKLRLTIGMTTSARRDGSQRIAHMIPSPVLLRALKQAEVNAQSGGESPEGLKRLRTKALECLRNEPDAVQRLAAAVPKDSQCEDAGIDHEARCERVIDVLLGGDATEMVDLLCRCYLEAVDGAQTNIAKVIESLCYLILPVVYRPEDLHRIGASVERGETIVSLPALHETSVEIIMAGVDGRGLQLHSATNSKNYPAGELLLQPLPEGGLDKTAEDALAAFQKQIGEKFLTSPSQALSSKDIQESIERKLKRRIKQKGYRYYYVYRQSGDIESRKRRTDVVQRLRDAFPSVVFIGLERAHDAPSEEDTLDALQQLLCRVAGIPWKL